MRLIDASLCGLDAELMDVSEIRRLAHSLLEFGIEALLVTPRIAECLHGIEKRCRVFMQYRGNDGVEHLRDLYAAYEDTEEEPNVCGFDYREWKRAKNQRMGDLEIFSPDQSLYFGDYSSEYHRILRATDGDICLNAGKSGVFSTALSYEWINAGGNDVLTSFFGFGGYAPTEELLTVLFVHNMLPNTMDVTMMKSLSMQFATALNYRIPPHKAVVGAHIFFVESGVHVNGIQKNTSCFEPFSPDKIGAHRTIMIGTHASPSMIGQILERNGIQPAPEVMSELVCRVRNAARGGKKNPQESDIMELYLKIIGERAG